jgi:hypothetical protein
MVFLLHLSKVRLVVVAATSVRPRDPRHDTHYRNILIVGIIHNVYSSLIGRENPLDGIT